MNGPKQAQLITIHNQFFQTKIIQSKSRLTGRTKGKVTKYRKIMKYNYVIQIDRQIILTIDSWMDELIDIYRCFASEDLNGKREEKDFIMLKHATPPSFKFTTGKIEQ